MKDPYGKGERPEAFEELGVACWERGRGEAVVLIHDFTTPGYEEIGTFPTFWDCSAALEEMIELEDE